MESNDETRTAPESEDQGNEPRPDPNVEAMKAAAEARDQWQADEDGSASQAFVDADLPSDVQDHMNALQGQLDKAAEQVKWYAAELENYKKRTQKEAENYRVYALESVFKDFLSVFDSLEIAENHLRESDSSSALLDSMTSINKQLESILGKHHVRKIEAAEQPFDPERHQAIKMETDTDTAYPVDTVHQVLQTGYTLGERVLRPAMVIVAKASATAKANTDHGNSDETTQP